MYHVLHRLSAPRHPLNALKALDRSHCSRPIAPHNRSIQFVFFSSLVRPRSGHPRRSFSQQPNHPLILPISSRYDAKTIGSSSNKPSIHNVRNQADATKASAKPCSQVQNQHQSGGARRDRTDDLMLAKHALSQLSYGPNCGSSCHQCDVMVGRGGLEPPTSRLSGVRSNRLSYQPVPLGLNQKEKRSRRGVANHLRHQIAIVHNSMHRG